MAELPFPEMYLSLNIFGAIRKRLDVDLCTAILDLKDLIICLITFASVSSLGVSLNWKLNVLNEGDKVSFELVENRGRMAAEKLSMVGSEESKDDSEDQVDDSEEVSEESE